MRKRLAGLLMIAAFVLPLVGMSGALGQTDPRLSENMRLITTVTPPETNAISLEFARTGDFMYASTLDSISAYDISDPKDPQLLDTLVNATFENESMTYGERMINGELKRFVIVGIDLFNVTPTSPEHIHVGFDRMLVVDVTDASKPFDPAVLADPTKGIVIAGDVDTTTSTHTVQCVSRGNCRYAYTAGHGGEFEIIDMDDPFNPTVLKKVNSPAAGPNAIFSGGAGHYWDVDAAGIAWHTGSGGAAAFDVSDPANPVLINATNGEGVKTPYNDFIHHNSMRPNADEFKAGRNPDVDRGNVLMVTEEDYANDGNEILCEQQTGTEAGTFQTWHIPERTDPTPGTKAQPSQGNITPLDIVNAPSAFADDATLDTPVGVFCSGHWFDYHQAGLVAQGYYQQGLWVEDVRVADDIKYYAHYTPVLSEIWDAYWVPARNDNGVDTGRNTNIIYTADLIRGIDVLQVTLPGAGGTPGKAPDGGSTSDGNNGGGGDGGGGGGLGTGPGGLGNTGGTTDLPASGGGRLLMLLGVVALPAAFFLARAPEAATRRRKY